MINLANMTIETAHNAMKNGEFSAVELATVYLENIKAKNVDINAYLEVFDDVMDQAMAADQKFADGTATLLTGIPFAVKDNILFKGRKSSAASKILENHVAVYDSNVAEKLREAGAVILGRVNMDEFAMGSSTENSAYGHVKNPLDTTKVAGGSSGGSAAAVAMEGALVALGSDTGGSIRQPAAFCGLVGLYPTYGSVSRYGLMALGSSLDQIGPIAKTVRDTEIIHEAISGKDPRDATSVSQETRDKLHQVPRGKVVGVPREFLSGNGLSNEIKQNFEDSLKKLESAGYEIRDIELPNAKYALPIYYIIMPAEASTNLSRYDGMRYGLRVDGNGLDGTYTESREAGFGIETQRRIMLGTYVLSAGYADAYYYKARDIRELIKQDFKKAFETVDIIATPTTPTTAFGPGENQDPVEMYMADIFTVPANIAGVPAISVPSGNDSSGLPMGLHMIAPYFCEDRLFQAGKDFESAS